MENGSGDSLVVHMEVPQAHEPKASVQIEYANLPSESRRKLDEALQAWASWHADKYLPGYVPPEVFSGSMVYSPDTMLLGVINVWEDRPAPPATSGIKTLWFNAQYERVGDVPRYDRSTDEQLYFSTRKRPADTLLAAEEAAAAAGAAGRPVKRMRANSRCFNCGSYGHSMRECWKELNAELVAESKREHAEAREASGAAYRSASKRYYLPGAGEGGGGNGGGRKGAAEQVDGEFEGLEPGKLSSELRAALGIGELDPPPWLHRMHQLGLPPGYMVPATAMEAAEAAGKQPESATGGAAAGGAGVPAGTQGAVGSGQEQAGGGQQGPAAGVDAGLDPLDDFIPLPGSTAGAAGEDAEGAAEGEEEAPVVLECRVQFPGINAPVPQGANELSWSQQLPPQQQHHHQQTPGLLPPGFGSGAAASAHATPPVMQRWQQPGGSADRAVGASSSGGLRMRPLRGLHPSSASEGSQSAARPSPLGGPQSGSTPWQHGASAALPNMYQQPQAQAQAAAAAHGYHHHHHPQQASQQPPTADRMLPPGYGQQHQHHQHHQQHQQQPPPPPPDDVYSISRSDPGHLLVYDQRLPPGYQKMAVAAPAAIAHQQQQPQLQQQHWAQQQQVQADHYAQHTQQHYQSQQQYQQYQPQQHEQQQYNRAETYSPEVNRAEQQAAYTGGNGAAGTGAGGGSGPADWRQQPAGGWYGSGRY